VSFKLLGLGIDNVGSDTDGYEVDIKSTYNENSKLDLKVDRESTYSVIGTNNNKVDIESVTALAGLMARAPRGLRGPYTRKEPRRSEVT
jgi:hypothetical protein